MNKDDILKKLQAGELSVDDAGKLLDEINAPKRGLYCKVSEKGAIWLCRKPIRSQES